MDRDHTGADDHRNSNVVRFAQRYNASKAVYQKKGDENHIVEDSDTGYISGPGTRAPRVFPRHARRRRVRGWFRGVHSDIDTLTVRNDPQCQNPPAGWMVENEQHERERIRLG